MHREYCMEEGRWEPFAKKRCSRQRGWDARTALSLTRCSQSSEHQSIKQWASCTISPFSCQSVDSNRHGLSPRTSPTLGVIYYVLVFYHLTTKALYPQFIPCCHREIRLYDFFSLYMMTWHLYMMTWHEWFFSCSFLFPFKGCNIV